MSNYTPYRAIEDSIREDRIVVMRAEIDTPEWENLNSALRDECDDYVEANDKIREYWGVNEDGDDWRVHVSPKIVVDYSIDAE